jgi:spore coat protein CotH
MIKRKLSLLFVLLIAMCASGFAQDLYDINTITTIELTFEETNWDYLLDQLYAAGNEERLMGTAVVNGIQFDSVGVRYKGNTIIPAM